MGGTDRPNHSRRFQPRRKNPVRSGHAGPLGNGREVAWSALANLNGLDLFAPQLLDQFLRESTLADPERRLATELVYGIVRRDAVLRTLLQKQIHRPWVQVEKELQTILLLGAYQLIFMNRIPAHAAVNTSVELCQRVGRGAARGFVNGVLRSVQRMLTEEKSENPSSKSLPLSDGEYLLLTEDLFPDPANELTNYFAVAFGFPEWLARRWGERFSREELLGLGFRLNSPPRMTLRVNSLQISRDEYFRLLEQGEIPAERGETAQGIRLVTSLPPVRLPLWETGAVTVQDETAQQAAEMLAPKSGERVWDVCAAPGGKATHLAELMRDEGMILATDVQSERLQQIHSAVERLKLRSIQVRPIQDVDEVQEEFDAVLIDVPCSNTGVLGKRPEARQRIEPADLKELPQIQKKILESASGRVVSQGRLVYSTCSIEPEENGEIVQAFLKNHPEWSLVSEREYLPSEKGDGGYQALLRKN